MYFHITFSPQYLTTSNQQGNLQRWRVIQFILSQLALFFFFQSRVHGIENTVARGLCAIKGWNSVCKPIILLRRSKVFTSKTKAAIEIVTQSNCYTVGASRQISTSTSIPKSRIHSVKFTPVQHGTLPNLEIPTDNHLRKIQVSTK